MKTPQPSRPSKEARLIGLAEIARLLNLTLARNSQGLSRTRYLQEYGIDKQVGSKLNLIEKGNDPGELKLDTIIKLASAIMKPGTKNYYGDTDALLAEFVAISEGWLDGIPPHLKDEKSRSLHALSLEELKEKRKEIDRLIEEKTIDLDAIEPRNRILCAVLDAKRTEMGLTRAQLAQRSIGVTAYAKLMQGTDPLTIDDFEVLAKVTDLEAIGLLSIYTSGISGTHGTQDNKMVGR